MPGPALHMSFAIQQTEILLCGCCGEICVIGAPDKKFISTPFHMSFAFQETQILYARICVPRFVC